MEKMKEIVQRQDSEAVPAVIPKISKEALSFSLKKQSVPVNHMPLIMERQLPVSEDKNMQTTNYKESKSAVWNPPMTSRN